MPVIEKQDNEDFGRAVGVGENQIIGGGFGGYDDGAGVELKGQGLLGGANDLLGCDRAAAPMLAGLLSQLEVGQARGRLTGSYGVRLLGSH